MPRPVEPEDDLPPNEWARARRRDHDTAAAARSGMRTGLAKQFKQVLDAQVKRAQEAASPAADDDLRVDDGTAADAELHPRYRHHHHRHEPQEGSA